MKRVKTLLLGSAAGLCAVAGAQAADLPVQKAAPVEYVRVCTAHGAGFFFIPGTDTCLRVGGRARFEYQYSSQNARATDVSSWRGLGRLNIDARTATPYGTLRAFIRFEIASRTGGYLRSGTQERFANAFPATGIDTAGQLQKYVDVDKAFVQFAGITAGRAQSFFDFYAGDLELIGSGQYSNTNTNLLAYTATFGSGFTATISIEDPIYRRAPVFAQAAPLSMGQGNGFGPALGIAGVSSIATGYFPGTTIPTGGIGVNVIQKNDMPDFVGALRYDSAWGSAQVMGSVHEIKTIGRIGTPVAVGPDAEYGWAIGAGVKVNLPQLAPGDQLWLQGAYGQGAGSYTGLYGPPGGDLALSNVTNKFQINQVDAVLQNNGQLNLTESWSVMGALLHYWSPEWRQAVFATYGQQNFDPRLRNNNFGPVGITGGAPLGATGPAGPGAPFVNVFNPTLMSYDQFYGGTNLIWSPVRDLDIGVEVVYQRIWLPRAVANNNLGTFAPLAGGLVTTGGAARVTSFDDNVMARIRVQRDF